MMQSMSQREIGLLTPSIPRSKFEQCLMVVIIVLTITGNVNSVEAQHSGYRAQVSNHWHSTLEAGESDQLIAGRLKAQTATAPIRHASAAEQALAEAEALRGQWTAASLAQAIGKYQEAMRYWRSAGDHAREASTLKAIGDVYVILSQNRKALTYYNQALSLSRAAGVQTLEVETLNAIGSIYIDLGEAQKTVEYCRVALKLSGEMSDIRGQAQALNNLGLVAYNHGEMERALESFNQSLTLSLQINDRQGQADALANLGYAYIDMGNVHQAMASFNQAIELSRQTNNRRGLALALTALGLQYTGLGEMQKALDAHNQAGQILQAIADRSGEARILNATGYVYYVLGEMEKSLDSLNRALKLQQALDRKVGEAVTLGYIGKIYESLGHKQQALNYYHRRLALNRALGDRRVEALTLKEIGVVYEALGQKSRALDYYNRALSLSRAAGDPRGQAYTLNQIAYFNEKAGAKPKALKLYEEALALITPSEDRPAIALMSHNIARVKRDLGDLAGATEKSRATLDIIESLRTKVDSPELRTSYFASTHEYYQLYIDVLMRRHAQNPTAGFQINALEASERARARSFLDLLATSHVDIYEGADKDLLQREHDLQQLLDTKTDRLAQLFGNRQKEQLAAILKKEIVNLTSEYNEIKTRLKVESPRYAALTQPQMLTVSQIQSLLDDDTTLLEYSLGEERSYLWVITPASIKTYTLPKRVEIENLARGLLDILNAYYLPQAARQLNISDHQLDSRYWQQAAQLSRMVLGPAASELKNKRLLLVTEGALQYIPFAGLPFPYAQENEQASQPPTPLLLNYEIISLPSASVFAALRQQAIPRLANGSVAVFADPVFDKTDSRVRQSPQTPASLIALRASRRTAVNLKRLIRSIRSADDRASFPRLPATRIEAEAILANAPAGSFLKALDFKASLATVKSSDMSRYKILHFATHGLLDGEHPELSAIVLSLVDEEGKSQNGFLRQHDIYNLVLPVDLVVLSACNTALGKDVKGEGLVGMTRGFMYAGAARVIASLWKVDDDATAELMKNFYQHMLRENQLPVVALRAAQIEMWNRRQWHAPYYWAAFLFQGEWN
jgi:CHAT domain-containing protein/tetratricopeptide (TPR) repeat protein